MEDRPTDQSTQPLLIDSKMAQLISVLDHYLADLNAGKSPSREEVLAAHPQLAEQLDACLGGIEFIHRAESSTGTGQMMGDFRIVRELGRGGMGAVYEAEQLSLGRRVALKVLRFGSVSDPDALERFEREATTVAKLHHTNIVPIFAVGNEHGIDYYAMQLVDGRSLDRVLKQTGQPLDANTVAAWGLQAAEALGHAHHRDVIHRDVKPSNLILDNEGRLWLTDFGLAKRMDDVTLSMTGALLGTPRYMSPEQAAASTRNVDHRTDIYSLGATLYELVTGHPVFAADTPHEVISQILSDDPQPLRRHRPDLPRDMETIVLKCLSKEPHERYKSASELSDDLRAFLDGRAIRARQSGPIELAVRWVKRHQRSVALTAGAVAATIAVAVAVILGWQRYESWKLSYVSLSSDQGPLVAEMVNEEGLPVTGAVTVPTQQPLSVPHGDYKVHVATKGTLSQAYDVMLPRGTRSEFEITPGDDVLAELDVERTVAFVKFAERTKPLLMDDDGVQLNGIDGAEWRLNIATPPDQLLIDAPGLVWPWDAVVVYLQRGGYDKFDLRPFLARWSTGGADRNTDSWTAIPCGDAVDLDGDAVKDIVLAARHQAWLMAVSGKSGRPLWFLHRGEEFQAGVDQEFRRNRKNYGVRSAVLYPPRWVNDIDGDDRADLLAVFGEIGIDEHNSHTQRWVEALSASTGDMIWRYDLPGNLFEADNETETSYALRWFVGGVHGYGTLGASGMSNWRGRMRRWSNRIDERMGPYVTMPTDLHVSVGEKPDTQTVSLITGSRLVELTCCVAGRLLRRKNSDLFPDCLPCGEIWMATTQTISFWWKNFQIYRTPQQTLLTIVYQGQVSRAGR